MVATLTPTAERLAVHGAVTTCFYDLGLSQLGFEHPTFRLRGVALAHCATAAVRGPVSLQLLCLSFEAINQQ